MRIDVESADLLALIAELATEAKNEARIRWPGTQADAVTMGVALLHEQIRLAVEDSYAFDLSPENDARVLQSAVSAFCLGTCHFSRAVPPGGHEACQECPLMPFTVAAVEQAVAKAVAPKRPSVLDPKEVAAARARLDASFKRGP